MSLVMLRYDDTNPEIAQVFIEFAIASSTAQEMEALLKVNLQYSLVLAREFEDLVRSDAS